MANTPGKPRVRSRLRTKTPDAEGYITGTAYCPEIAREIVTRIADGESWASMANTGKMPAHRTLYLWRDRYPALAEALVWARTVAAELKADRALAVAEATTARSVTADRLHFNALMQRAAFDAPERWSDKPRTPAKAAARVEYVFHLRHFEKVIGPDGQAFVREIKRRGRRS
jgi:hypothetical protein